MGVTNGSPSTEIQGQEQHEGTEGAESTTLPQHLVPQVSHTAVFAVQATPKSTFADSLRKALVNSTAPDGGKTLVVEKGGRSIIAGLKNPDPYRILGCQYQEQCMIDSRQSCCQSGIVFSLTCTTCRAAYTRTSGLTAHKRGMEHLAAVRRGDTSCAMGKHYTLKHPDWDKISAPFPLTILKTPRLVGNL